MNEIDIKNFSKFYENKNQKAACIKINFQAKLGDIVGILGPNGAGKSTLLKTICGIQYPSSGQINIFGKSQLHEFRKICAYVPEVPELNKNLTVKESLFFASNLTDFKTDAIKKNIKTAIEISELEEVLNKKISSLSKGFLQRTSLALAICKNPKVLILDEFSAGLDPLQNLKIQNQIKNLAKNKIIILSSHNLEESQKLCSKFYILKQGQIVSFGTLQEILSQSKSSSLEDAYIKLTS